MMNQKDEELIKLKSKLDKIEYDCQFKAYVFNNLTQPLVKSDGLLEVHLFWNDNLVEM